jgi:hypothetical protein
MVSMLTVIKIGSNSDASVAKLRDIDKALAQARMVEDIKLLKISWDNVWRPCTPRPSVKRQRGRRPSPGWNMS